MCVVAACVCLHLRGGVGALFWCVLFHMNVVCAEHNCRFMHLGESVLAGVSLTHDEARDTFDNRDSLHTYMEPYVGSLVPPT